MEQAAESIKDALTEQVKDLVNTQGDAWKKFAKTYAKDLAQQAWVIKTAKDDATKAQARENIEYMRLDADAEISKAGLALIGGDSGQAILKHLLGLAGKLAVGLLV